jgi:hypothetical protein
MIVLDRVRTLDFIIAKSERVLVPDAFARAVRDASAAAAAVVAGYSLGDHMPVTSSAPTVESFLWAAAYVEPTLSP